MNNQVNVTQRNIPAPSPTPAIPVTEETKFQHYTCSRSSMRMITATGRRITFVKGQYFTHEEDIIKYLDEEIKLGLRVVTKGQLMTRKESDPMEMLRAQHIAEYLASKKEEAMDKAAGVTKDMGATKSKEKIDSGAKPASSGLVVGGKDNVSK